MSGFHYAREAEMTGKEWAQKRAEMFEPGAVILCVENTYIPARDGTTRTVERAGATVSDCRTPDGKPYRMEMPQRVGTIEHLPDGSIRYPLGGPATKHGNHFVTLRRVA